MLFLWLLQIFLSSHISLPHSWDSRLIFADSGRRSFSHRIGVLWETGQLCSPPEYGKQVNYTDTPEYGKQVNFTDIPDYGKQVNFADGP
ncbi:hypothetical protein ACPYLM_004886, partial [Enterobacter roggenkampii]|uniref:Uncharacterized protein n=1 Tax=Enterobacter roggenkampii TaxID=1812935 RepID=A0AAU9CFF7_9ENTR|nr:hypothetical protein C3399_25425 [Enterobacter cloacae complex sp. ECNIH14]BCL45757.1 hypothetical protein OIPHN260_52600 [Enterobacter roggenkampii]SAA65495.1 Uncharacterised protein [Enterobacter roggenkampii]